ncbi:MAG: hypothetical protein ABFS56_00950 [Pseudomonadota bacterium]
MMNFPRSHAPAWEPENSGVQGIPCTNITGIIMWIRLGIILLIILIAVMLTRRNKIWSIITIIGGLILATYIILIMAGGIYHWQSEIVPPEQVVLSFMQDMNPELNQKMTEIAEEITLADNKIQQLHDLKKAFPNQAQMIDQKINQWQTLRAQLNQVSNDIDQRVEKAYVTYKIDEIQGRKKFSLISQELLNEANTVLANAEATKSTIEEQLDE